MRVEYSCENSLCVLDTFISLKQRKKDVLIRRCEIEKKKKKEL